MAGRIIAAGFDALLSNGKRAAKSALKNGSNSNGFVPKGVKLRPKIQDLHSGELAKKQAVERRLANINALRKIDDRAEVFDVDKVSDRYSQFLNKPVRRGDDKIYPKEARS